MLPWKNRLARRCGTSEELSNVQAKMEELSARQSWRAVFRAWLRWVYHVWLGFGAGVLGWLMLVGLLVGCLVGGKFNSPSPLGVLVERSHHFSRHGKLEDEKSSREEPAEHAMSRGRRHTCAQSICEWCHALIIFYTFLNVFDIFWWWKLGDLKYDKSNMRVVGEHELLINSLTENDSWCYGQGYFN